MVKEKKKMGALLNYATYVCDLFLCYCTYFYAAVQTRASCSHFYLSLDHLSHIPGPPSRSLSHSSAALCYILYLPVAAPSEPQKLTNYTVLSLVLYKPFILIDQSLSCCQPCVRLLRWVVTVLLTYACTYMSRSVVSRTGEYYISCCQPCVRLLSVVSHTDTMCVHIT